MKKWICMSLMALFSFDAGAQVGFGIRAGVSYASLTQIVDEKVTYGDRLGACVAGLVDIPLSRKFSLRPELVLLNLGGAYDVEYVTEGPYLKVERVKSSYYSLQIPLNFTYKIFVNNWQFGVYGGPALSVSTPVREKVLPAEERKFRPFDVGMGVGFYVQHRRLFTSLYTCSGLVDRRTRKQSHESQLYQNIVALSLGYWF
jgi:hypothetical protein